VLAALTAVLLAASLVIETAFRSQVALGQGLAFAGLACLVLAVLVPYRPHSSSSRRRDVSEPPHFGHTRHGLPVHARTADHHPDGTAYQKFNKRVAVWLTDHVGTMTCFWIFCGLALCSLPAVLSGFSAFSGVFPDWMVRASDIALVAWIAQTFIQLVLLPGLMVGQSLQNAASDARAAKQFEDTEQVRADLITALDRLDEKTEGGLKAVLDAVNALASHPASAKRLATPAERREGSGT